MSELLVEEISSKSFSLTPYLEIIHHYAIPNLRTLDKDWLSTTKPTAYCLVRLRHCGCPVSKSEKQIHNLFCIWQQLHQSKCTAYQCCQHFFN